MLLPATNDLNSKSTPVFCLKTPSPVPTLLAVFTSPPPPPPPELPDFNNTTLKRLLATLPALLHSITLTDVLTIVHATVSLSASL